MSDREEFESWAADKKGIRNFTLHDDGDYESERLCDMKEAWQAARAQGGEAVAWSWVSRGRHVTVDKSHAEELRADGELVVPLYTRPSAAVSNEEELAKFINFLFTKRWEEGKRFDFDGLRAALCRIGVVAQKDGYDLVRRSSVVEIVEGFRPRSPAKGVER